MRVAFVAAGLVCVLEGYGQSVVGERGCRRVKKNPALLSPSTTIKLPYNLHISSTFKWAV